MRTLAVPVEDEVDEALDAVSARMGCNKVELVGDILRRYARAERLRECLQEPGIAALYRELEDEGAALAELGMADFAKGLTEADRP